MAASIEKCSSHIYRLLKNSGKPKAGPEAITHTEGISYSMTDILGLHTATWKKWWEAKAVEPATIEEEVWFQAPSSRKPTILELKAVSRSFKTVTSCPDKLHPRQIESLSNDTLEALSWIICFWEAGAGHPIEEQVVLTKLIPKQSGPGLRPINLFRTIVRLHHRLRGQAVKEWHRNHTTASQNNRAGRHVGDACYRA